MAAQGKHGETSRLGLRGESALELLQLGDRGHEKSDESRSAQSTSADAEAAAVGHRVASARAKAGLTGEQLGARVGLRKDQISKVERGRRRVSTPELPAFATALGVTVKFLLGGDEPPRVALAHRLTQLPARGARELSPTAPPATQRRALELLRVETALLRHTELPPPRLSVQGAQVRRFVAECMTRRPRTKAEAQRQGRGLAEEVRKALDLGSAEIGDLATLIEMHFAADVALSPLGTSVDGLCAHAEGRAVLVVSSDYPEGHIRFTLAHELGHHLLADPREVIDEVSTDMYADDVLERRVNAFAGHLLMPSHGVAETLAWLGVDASQLRSGGVRCQRALGTLMHRFGASLPAVLFHLADLKALEFDDARRLCGTLSAATVRRAGDGGRLDPDTPAPAAPLAEDVTGRVRPPRRLLDAAIEGARAELFGTAAAALLLEREDDDTLFQEIVGVRDGALMGVAAESAVFHARA